LATEYVLRVPLDRHIINTRRPFAAVMADLRRTLACPEPEVRHAPVASALVGLAEFDIERPSQAEPAAGHLIRLIVDHPAATSQLLRLLPEAGIYSPMAILVQQIPDVGTRLAYDTIASAISMHQDEESSAVARALDDEVLALLRRIATPRPADETPPAI